MENKLVHKVAKFLLILGGIAWGTLAFGFNLVTWLLGLSNLTQFAWVVEGLVGISAVYLGYHMFKHKDY